MTYPSHLIPTTVVGSYPQPDWLIDRAKLEGHGVPRVHAHDIWRIPEPYRGERSRRSVERERIARVEVKRRRRERYCRFRE
jgi:hypothetical protein